MSKNEFKNKKFIQQHLSSITEKFASVCKQFSSNTSRKQKGRSKFRTLNLSYELFSPQIVHSGLLWTIKALAQNAIARTSVKQTYLRVWSQNELFRQKIISSFQHLKHNSLLKTIGFRNKTITRSLICENIIAYSIIFKRNATMRFDQKSINELWHRARWRWSKMVLSFCIP